ncbi:MAG: hypothetical protein HWN79_02260 [Candidatus Lokiarchaeota archaeon]|nr:hypothetical protein [Candidatus Lokiarchaeota archaeon]
MVFKNLSRIKTALPEVIHIVMFYNNGTIFQTTFEHDINIPKLGDNLAELIHHVRNVYELSQFKMDSYKKLIFETENVSVIILKLGEESNIALFFKKEEETDLNLSSIKRYITRIESLIDMNEEEIILEEILMKEGILQNVRNLLQLNQEKLQSIHDELKSLDENVIAEASKQLEKELISLNEEHSKLERDIIKYQEEILDLRHIIEK